MSSYQETFATSTECREMKHKWCHNEALDVEADQLIPCQCNCHDEAEEGAV